ENKAANYKAEGDAQAARIIADARASEQRIMAAARRKADEIRNEGQRIVSQIYSQFQEHQDLRIFLDKLSALEQAFKDDATIIMDSRFAPIDLFNIEESETTGTLDLDQSGSVKTITRSGQITGHE
ncbi:MAG: hypothetical protein V3W34_12590, partial [Phycisphaerae bacterium]